MRLGGRTVGLVATMITVAAPAAAAAAEPGAAAETVPVSAPVSGSVPASGSEPVPVLITPVQGSATLSAERQGRIVDAIARALEARGYAASVDEPILGQAVVACQSPECVVQSLDAAEAEFAIVPAAWSKEDGSAELTLTLVQRLGRNLNASGPVGDDLSAAAVALVDALLAQRAVSVPVSAPEPAPAPPPPKHPHAWKAGPIILIAASTAPFIAIGVAAATRSDTEQLDTSSVAIWSAIGAAAIGGGIAWWVVGAKRRKRAAEVTVHPAGIDLRLRF